MEGAVVRAIEIQPRQSDQTEQQKPPKQKLPVADQLLCIARPFPAT